MARVSFGPPDSISGNPSVTEIGDGDLKSHVLVARGYPLPLGLSARGEGANFAVYSRESEDFSLVLYPPETAKDSKRIEIKLSAKFNRTGQVWHGMYISEAIGSILLLAYIDHDPQLWFPRTARGTRICIGWEQLRRVAGKRIS
mmetsp:Transcript_21151/g.86349  ORF Transcript_21151/g.86349 Transcript_21151/m.86349 type:complete len:144 (+) Transcript_21151:346-777(+)